MSRMSELAMDQRVVLPDPAFDTYRLECTIKDLRGHYPGDLDFNRILKCSADLNMLARSILNAQRGAA